MLDPIRFISLFLIVSIMMNCGRGTSVNVYDSIDLGNLPPDLLSAGERVYTNSCYACHTYGTAGAASLFDIKEWDRVAERGMDPILKSVLEGYRGINGVMPPKGNCWTCTEAEIRASILYIFHEVRNNKLKAN